MLTMHFPLSLWAVNRAYLHTLFLIFNTFFFSSFKCRKLWILFLSFEQQTSPLVFPTRDTTHMAGAESKRKETFPLGESSNIHSSCFVHVGHFVAVSFSNTCIPSAALRRTAQMDGKGKACGLKRPAGCELKAQCTECQQHLGQTVLQWMPTYIPSCRFL